MNLFCKLMTIASVGCVVSIAQVGSGLAMERKRPQIGDVFSVFGKDHTIVQSTTSDEYFANRLPNIKDKLKTGLSRYEQDPSAVLVLESFNNAMEACEFVLKFKKGTELIYELGLMSATAESWSTKLTQGQRTEYAKLIKRHTNIRSVMVVVGKVLKDTMSKEETAEIIDLINILNR